MNTRRLITTTVSTAALAAGLAAGLASAQAEIAQRIDEGTSGSRGPVTDDCSLRFPCTVIADEVSYRTDTETSSTLPTLVDDCSLRAPCSAVRDDRNATMTSKPDTVHSADRSLRGSAVADRNVAMIRGAARDTYEWSYADDGTLELRVNGVIHRNGRLLP